MRKPVIDRMADTTAFRALLLLSGIVVLPVLALGVVVSLLIAPSGIWRADPSMLTIVLLSTGGVIGMTGWIRAHLGMHRPEVHNVDATLICLGVGIGTALTLGAAVLIATVSGSRGAPGSAAAWSMALGGGFAATQAVWILSAVAWMERLTGRFRERTGRAFDTLPLVLLVVALALALTAVLVTTFLV